MSEISSYTTAEEAKVKWSGHGVLVPKENLPVTLRDLVADNAQGGVSILEDQRNDPSLTERIPLYALRYKYKKEIEKDILKGYLSGTLYFGGYEVDWLWDVKCFADGIRADIHDILDHEELEDVTGRMLDGEASGSIEKLIEYQVTIDVIDVEGNLVCGDVTVSNDYLFLGSFFSTDGSNVVFSEDIGLGGDSLRAIKAAIIEMLEEQGLYQEE